MKEFCVVLPLLFDRLEHLRQVMEKHSLATDIEPVSHSHRHWQWSLGRGHLELRLEVNLDDESVEWSVSPISNDAVGILVATWMNDDQSEACWHLISTTTKKTLRAPEIRLLDQLRTRRIMSPRPHVERRATHTDALVAFDETCALLATLPSEPIEETDDANAA